MVKYTTIRLRRDDYKKLQKAKRKLEEQIGETSISAAIGFLAGLLGGITFTALLANSIKRSQFFKCSCGEIIDLTDWSGPTFQCRSCGARWQRVSSRTAR